MILTDNFDLNLVEGSDVVNLLTQMNPNTEKIDEQMFKNQNAGVQSATELLSGTVHAITRVVPDASMIRFTAVSRFTAGDTFTVDGVQVSALLPSGEQLPDGAFIIGSEVLCVLKGTLLTVFAGAGVVAMSQDSAKLGGNPAEYYASNEELDLVKNTANSAGDIAESNTQKINKIMPCVKNNFDMESGVPLAQGVHVTVPEDGIVLCGGYTGSVQWGAFGLNVNGLNVVTKQAGIANANIYDVFTYRVWKGDDVILSASNGGGVTTFNFYKYK